MLNFRKPLTAGYKHALNNFLINRGFELTEQDVSKYFGDFIYIYSDGNINVRLISDKNMESIDISSVLHPNEWYDLSLVKNLLYNESVVNSIIVIENYIGFLQKNLAKITELFNGEGYPITKKRLEELGNARSEQMF